MKKFYQISRERQLLVATGVHRTGLSDVGHFRPREALGGVGDNLRGQHDGTGKYLAFANAHGNVDSELGHLLTQACKVAFCVGYSIGVGPATWALAVELSPLRGGGCDFGTACVFYWASALAIMSLVWTFSYSATSLALMAFFAASSTLVNGIGAFFLLPDTDSVSLEAILLEGQKNRPQKLRAAHEPTQSSATQQGEEGQKKKQEKPKPPASKQVASAGRSPVHSKLSMPSPGKQASRALSPVSSQFPHDHHSRANDLQEDNVKGVSSPEVQGQKTSSSGKVAAADSARSGRLNLPSGET
ncbi:uncharacterized protein LOC142804007 [Rhipicephalus microplus]|uniref:uncharacterized protein LOC142804007 n=1 Tax=Rhipicephalus microplus TaxID=6941 RepID=UPI003F6C568D